MTNQDETKRGDSRPLWTFPRSRHPLTMLEKVGDDWDWQEVSSPSGLSVYENESHVFVEAAVPGIPPEDIDLFFDKGILWIKAEKTKTSEDKKRKYYRKALSTFSYRVAIPGDVDESKQPDAVCKQGILTITFYKIQIAAAKKIPIKSC